MILPAAATVEGLVRRSAGGPALVQSKPTSDLFVAFHGDEGFVNGIAR